MDHAKVNTNDSSEIMDKSDHEINTPQEYDTTTLFWYDVLYAIGSHFVDNAKLLRTQIDINPENFHKHSTFSRIKCEVPLDDHLTKLFCGYWILYNIANIANIANVADSNDPVTPSTPFKSNHFSE